MKSFAGLLSLLYLEGVVLARLTDFQAIFDSKSRLCCQSRQISLRTEKRNICRAELLARAVALVWAKTHWERLPL